MSLDIEKKSLLGDKIDKEGTIKDSGREDYSKSKKRQDTML